MQFLLTVFTVKQNEAQGAVVVQCVRVEPFLSGVRVFLHRTIVLQQGCLVPESLATFFTGELLDT